MKIIKKFALPLIFLLHLYPVLHVIISILLSSLDARCQLIYDKYSLAYAIIVFAATLFGAVFRRQIMPEKGFGRACAPFLLPLALINSLGASLRDNLVSCILVALSCICALIIFLVASNKLWKRILSYVVSAPLATIATIMLLPALISFGSITVVQEVKSPDGQYTAYLTDVDQGALGGDTRIEIMKKPINTPFGRYTSYYYLDYDNWAGVGILSEITFEWKDNDTLIYGISEINIEQ